MIRFVSKIEEEVVFKDMEYIVIELINKYNVFYVFYNKSCLAVAIDKGFIWTNPTSTYRITHLHPIN